MFKRWFGVIVILGMLALSLLAYSHLPVRVATHWGFDGQVDGTSSRIAAVLFGPLIALAVGFVFWIIQRPGVDPVLRDRAALQPTLRHYSNYLLLFLAAIHGLILAYGMGWPLDVGKFVQQDRAQLVGAPMACRRGKQQPTPKYAPDNGNRLIQVNQQGDAATYAELQAYTFKGLYDGIVSRLLKLS